jgi:hypothetical protein
MCIQHDLTIIKKKHTKHTKTRRHGLSDTDIIALISTHSPEILFLTETPAAKDCSALCGILSN